MGSLGRTTLEAPTRSVMDAGLSLAEVVIMSEIGGRRLAELKGSGDL